MTTAIPVRQHLSQRLRDNKKFRQSFFRSRTRNKIAAELRQLRELRGLKQADLKKKFGIHQSAISRIEKAEYSSWTYKTLLNTTELLDGVLEISIRPSEELIDQYHAEETEEEIQFSREEERKKEAEIERKRIATRINTIIVPKTGQLNMSLYASEAEPARGLLGMAPLTGGQSNNPAFRLGLGSPNNRPIEELGGAANQTLARVA